MLFQLPFLFQFLLCQPTVCKCSPSVSHFTSAVWNNSIYFPELFFHCLRYNGQQIISHSDMEKVSNFEGVKPCIAAFNKWGMETNGKITSFFCNSAEINKYSPPGSSREPDLSISSYSPWWLTWKFTSFPLPLLLLGITFKNKLFAWRPIFHACLLEKPV